MAKTSGLHVFVSVTALHADLTWSFAIRGVVHQNNVEILPLCPGVCVCVGRGDTLDGGKNQNSKKSLGLPKNLPKTPGPKNKSPKIP